MKITTKLVPLALKTLFLTLMLLPTGCILAVDASDQNNARRTRDRKEAVRLLAEKVGYLQQIERKLEQGVATQEQRMKGGSADDGSLRKAEIKLLEARARRIDCQLELASWRRVEKKKKKRD